MKNLLLIIALAFAGRSQLLEENKDGTVKMSDSTGNVVTVFMVTKDGNKFAVAVTSHGSVSICQIHAQ